MKNSYRYRTCIMFTLMLAPTLHGHRIPPSTATLYIPPTCPPATTLSAVCNYAESKRQQFKKIYMAATAKKEFIPSTLVALKTLRNNWPKNQRKQLHTQLDHLDKIIKKLTLPYKQEAFKNLWCRIKALDMMD